jgi:hypothetical protein
MDSSQARAQHGACRTRCKVLSITERTARKQLRRCGLTMVEVEWNACVGDSAEYNEIV